MRKIITILLLTLAYNAFAADNETLIKNYKKQYSILVTKWEKEKDVTKRKSIKNDIEKLKAKNAYLFQK